jgi:hypothetical protein
LQSIKTIKSQLSSLHNQKKTKTLLMALVQNLSSIKMARVRVVMAAVKAREKPAVTSAGNGAPAKLA